MTLQEQIFANLCQAVGALTDEQLAKLAEKAKRCADIYQATVGEKPPAKGKK